MPSNILLALVPLMPPWPAAAAGLTDGLRNLAAAVAPVPSGLTLQTAAPGLPLLLTDGLKEAYDLRKVPLRV